MTEDSCSEVRLSQGHLLPGFGKMMTMSKDVGLVVVGADLVGLVYRHTPGQPAASCSTLHTAVRGRAPPPLWPRSLVQILPSSSSDILVLIWNCLYKHPRRFGERPHL